MAVSRLRALGFRQLLHSLKAYAAGGASAPRFKTAIETV